MLNPRGGDLPALRDHYTLLAAMNQTAAEFVDRQIVPSGYAALESNYGGRVNLLRQDSPYWMLRDTRYGTFDPMYQHCQMLARKYGEDDAAAQLGESAVMLPRDARRFISREEEQQYVVISGLGQVAILTEHTHLAKVRVYSVTSDKLKPEAAINPNAVAEHGYTTEEMYQDFLTDLENHQVFAKETVETSGPQRLLRHIQKALGRPQ
jgi:hypothetical protein